MNLHFLFFDAIAQCFELIPLGGAVAHTGLMNLLIKLSSGLFVISLQLAAPVLVALLFTMAALGLAARAVPQLNVFVLSFPISFFVGLLVYIATFPFMPEWMNTHFTNTHNHLLTALSSLKP
jgi:flagellar biosynthetic protein FliR